MLSHQKEEFLSEYLSSYRNGISKLKELPACLGELTSLEKLLCYRSNIKEFPVEITKWVDS